MKTHLLAGEGVIRMAPSLFTSGVRPRHKVSKRNFNSGPDPRSKFLGLALAVVHANKPKISINTLIDIKF